jgi:TonB family protein
MKKVFFSSLIAVVLMLVSCQNQTKKEEVKTDTLDMSPPPMAEGTKADSTPPPIEPVVEDNKLYDFVSLTNPPTYPGGIEKLYEFLGQNIQYPSEAIEKKVEGNVHLTFTVEKDGSVREVKVFRKLGSGTDEEAVRVLKLSKKWNPGMNEGKLVRVKYALPIKFSLGK